MAAAQPFFNLESRRHVVIVRLVPAMLDSSNVDALFSSLNQAVRESGSLKVLLDMAAVRYMNSLAIGLLTSLHQKLLQSGGELRLCHLQPFPLEILTRVKTVNLLEIRNTEAEALAGF